MSARKKKNQIKIDQEIWPLEHDVLFRPDRVKYVRKLVKPKGCVFCKSAKSQISVDSLLLFKTRYSMVVLNKFPYNNGHLLVLPLRHCGSLLKLKAKEYQDLMETLRLAIKAVESCYAPPGFNLGMNHGACAGAGIPEHLHLHIVPRWAGDTNFFPLLAKSKTVIETLDHSFNRLLVYFKKVKK